MPLTIQKPKPFDIANQASKLPRPFQKPAAMLGSLASEFLPAQEDVIGQVMPTPLVSMFKDVGVRKMFTDEAVEELKALYPKHLHQAIDELAERVPRTMAHTRFLPDDTLFDRTGAEGIAHWNEVGPTYMGDGARIPVELDKQTAASSGGLDVPVHELTHVAQRLGNKDVPQIYAFASKGLEEHPMIASHNQEVSKQGAYINNPFERSARSTALRKTRDNFPVKWGDEIPAKPAMKGLEGFLEVDPENKYLRDATELMRARSGK